MKVRIQGQDAVGEVLELTGKKAIVGFGQIRTTIDLKRLEAISNSEYKKVTRSLRPTTASSASYDTAERRVHFSQQIDVRGMRASEALDATQEFIDDAIMLGLLRSAHPARQRHRRTERRNPQIPAYGRFGRQRQGRTRRVGRRQASPSFGSNCNSRHPVTWRKCGENAVKPFST